MLISVEKMQQDNGIKRHSLVKLNFYDILILAHAKVKEVNHDPRELI